jgi:hypothetical protein
VRFCCGESGAAWDSPKLLVVLISRFITARCKNPKVFIRYETYEPQMKREDRATISVSKKTHADFEKYRATLSAERGKVQTQEDVVRALLEMTNE